MNLNKWYKSLTTFQKVWVFGATAAIFILGIISKDTPMNIAIGTIGMLYVSVYGTGARSSFLLGIVYVSLYTVICLQNRIMLDAFQNILIPLHIKYKLYLNYLRMNSCHVKLLIKQINQVKLRP